MLQFGSFLLLLAAHLTSQAQNNFEWKDISGNTHNLSDLEEVLRKHREWITSGGKSGTQANLIGANLSGADLSDAHLSAADLRDAQLRHANLIGADRVEMESTGTVGELLARLVKRYPHIAGLLEKSAIAINDEFADDAAAIPAGAEVAEESGRERNQAGEGPRDPAGTGNAACAGTVISVPESW